MSGDKGTIMKTLSVNRAGALAAFFLLSLAGCVRVPAGWINADRADFGQVIQESWKRQTLLNVVRMRYADVPMFLDIASVINSYTLGGNVSAGGSLQKAPSTDAASLAAGGYWSNTPTVTYQPLMGERFTRSLLQPVTPAAVFQLLQGGMPPDLVMRTLVKSVNGLRNDSLGVPGDPEFREFVETLTRIQAAGGLGSRVEARKDGSALIMILRQERGGTSLSGDVRRMGELLRLEPGIGEIEVVYGMAPRSGTEIAVLTRTMLGIIMELGMDIDLPAGASAGGRAAPSPPKGDRPRPARDIRIRSGRAAPADAYAAVPYKGSWYWIDDADIASKRTFTFVMILFSLAETGSASVAPVVTVPSR